MRDLPNNFDFLRLFAALCVLASHQYALLHLAEPLPIPGLKLGALGVCIFFSISGYLVAQSWTRDPRILCFVVKRFLRIWPGLAVVSILCALALGPVVTTLPLNQYFGSSEFTSFFHTLGFNISFFLPGVFTSNPYPNTVNGSLWTIPLEVKCYGALLVAGVCGLLRFRWGVLAATVGLAVYYFAFLKAPFSTSNDALMRYGLFFCAGTCMHLFRDWRDHGWMAAPLAIAVFIALTLNNSIAVLWLLLPFAVILIGTMTTPLLRSVGRFGDLSYGTYIYAYPVQQTLVWATHGSLSYPVYLMLALVITIALAFASWHCIEAPALRLKPRNARKLGLQSNAEVQPQTASMGLRNQR